MVGVLVGDEDGVQRLRLLARQLHAPEEFPATQPAIDQNARPPAGDNRALPLEPDASTVKRTMVRGYRDRLPIGQGRNHPAAGP